MPDPTAGAPGAAAPTVVRAVGAMTGTSGDGVDLALVETDGETRLATLATHFLPFTDADRATVLAAAEHLAALGRVPAGDPHVAAAARVVTERHIEAAAGFARTAGFDWAGVDVLGMHGQTLFHDPAAGVTLQVGDAAAVAAGLGVAVASNFRMADIRDGGEGAPLAPIYHRLIAGADSLPAVVVNIGGISNVTWLGADGGVVGFDTGAGNGALDRFVRARTGDIDRDGAVSAKGRVDRDLLARWMASPFYDRPPPKSLDRAEMLVDVPDGTATADGAATLVALVAEGLAAALGHLPGGGRDVRRWIVSGGGRRNPSILAAMRARLPGEVTTVEALGRDGDMVEAELFALLGVRRLAGRPSLMPRPGGRTAEVLLGDLHRP